VTAGRDLLGPAPTRLPLDDAAEGLRAQGLPPAEVAAAHPADPASWAALAEIALAAPGEAGAVAAYAYARTGYHRGLDALRRAGWKGWGPVPWDAEGNRGWLRCVGVLAAAAARIGEQPEVERLHQLLDDSDPGARARLLPG